MPPPIPEVEITEVDGALKILPAKADGIQIIVGNSPGGPLLTPLLYNSIPNLMADFAPGAEKFGGDAIEAAALSLEETEGTPIVFCRVPDSNPGELEAIDISGVTGTCLPEADGVPTGTLEGYWICTTGGTLGVDGIEFKWSLSDDRNLSAVTALGQAYSFTMPDAGFDLLFEPPAAQLTAFIAGAVEARADTLAHLADVVAHDVADTSAAQVALAASAVPTTGPQAFAVLNLCRLALASHESSLTAHNGPDGVNVVAHGAATDVQTGIDLYVEYHADFNAHLGIAHAASTAGLLVATASSVAVQTYLTAALLAPGLALMNTYARRVSFTTSGAPTSAAPSTATIVGTDYLGAAQTEVFAGVPQTATTAFTAAAFKTITSITYGAGDGAGALVAIGYGQGVHNSADVTNTIAAANPTHGTLVAGDVIRQKTVGPKWATDDLTDAFLAIKLSQHVFEAIQVIGPVSATEAATLATGEGSLRTVKKYKWFTFNARVPDAGETDSAYQTSIKADFLGWTNTKAMKCAGSWRETSAVSGRSYTRPVAPIIAARAMKLPLHVDLAKNAEGPLTRGVLYDSTQTAIGHDENFQPGLNAAGFATLRTFANLGTEVYITNPLLSSPVGSDFDLLQKRRLMNVLEEVVYLEGVKHNLSAEGDVNDVGFIDEVAARDIEQDFRDAITARLRPGISNPDAPELFILSRTDPVLQNGGELNFESRLQPLFYIKTLRGKVGFTLTSGGGG
jgi:hypothetical protein